MQSTLAEPSQIRDRLVQKMLGRFRAALPLYKDMMDVADTINRQAGDDVAESLGRVMHAAIRCASTEELRTVARLFRLMGLEPVNYYDLREKVAVESTAFRSIDQQDIRANGFRMFCSVLAIDCIAEEHRPFVQSIIDRRAVFAPHLVSLLEQGEAEGGLDEESAELFVDLCVELFTRPEDALVSLDEYERLREINKVAAQVLVSNALAINHLTPSVASVPRAHEEMRLRGIKTIPVWQGPVGRDVILRQTSCLAPATLLRFPNADGTFTKAEHQETFVEFEERQQALTREGRILFERLYASGKASLSLAETDPGFESHYYEVMRAALEPFPGDAIELWKRGLAYIENEVVREQGEAASLEEAIETGLVRLVPQKYEDFFGPAATNIFYSNIGLEGVANVGGAKPDSVVDFEARLGAQVLDMYDYYDGIERLSRESVSAALGLSGGTGAPS